MSSRRGKPGEELPPGGATASGWCCTGWCGDRPPWGQGKRLPAEGAAFCGAVFRGAVFWGAARCHAVGRLHLHGSSTKGWNCLIRFNSQDGTWHPRDRGPSLGARGDTVGTPSSPGRPRPFPAGAGELLSPPAAEPRAGIDPGGSELSLFLPRRVGSPRLLMPRLPCVAPISDVIFIDGWNDLILIMCCLEVQYLRGYTVTMSFRCIICLIQY